MNRPLSSRVQAILDEAEAQLKDIIEDCLASGSYIDMAVVAGVADAIRTLSAGAVAQLDSRADDLRPEPRPGKRLESSQREAMETPARASRPVGRQSSRAASYPRFEREGERLIKIGWSKKERAEYEHKAPLSGVVTVCRNLRLQTTAFAMEQILPMRDDGGEDIPSYQVYLIVSWLRQLGIVERSRDEGYTVLRARLDDSEVLVAFNTLPSRRQGVSTGESDGDRTEAE